MRKKHFIILLAFLIFCLLFLVYYFWFSAPPPADESTFREEYALLLKDYSGNEVKLSDYRREILIVYAWASWCPYCGKELEYLSELKGRYGEELSIVAVNRAEPLVDAKDFTDKLAGMDRLVLLLDSQDSLFQEIGGYAMPETIFINSRGDIIYHQRGPIKPEEVDAKVAELMQ
jgi:cytochrome c biogenesis protein CcmG, thiol:disulfide interchange protein DsbE